MKKAIKGIGFVDMEDKKQKMAEALKGIKIYEFKNCCERWKTRLGRCIALKGEYFEGD